MDEEDKEFNHEEYLKSLSPGVREDMESGNKGAWTVGPAEVIAGAAVAPILTGAFGLDKVIDVGLGALFPDAGDTAFEQKLRLLPKIGTKAAVTSKVFRTAIDEAFSPNRSSLPQQLKRHESITRLSTLRKQVKNREILSQYDDGLIDDILSNPDAIYPPGSIEDEIQKSVQAMSPSPLPQWGPKGDPRTRWSKSEQIAEAKVRKDQFADAALGADPKNPLVYKPEEPVSSKGVPISKRRESGYRFEGNFAAEWNAWSKSVNFFDELADDTGTAFVEHLVGKGDRLNWFWRLPDEVRSWRPGTRHSPNNVRLFYSDRQKKLKDAVENLFYPTQENVPDMKRLLVDYDLPPVKPGESITVRKPSGDIVLRRVDGTVVGRIGDYHDVLYAPTEDLAKGLTTNINPRTGKFYIDPNTGNMKKAIRKWREEIIKNKLNEIINEAPNIEGKPASVVYQQQAGKIIDEDLAAFRNEYNFIPKPKGSTLDTQIKNTSFEGPPPDLPLLNDLLSMKPKPEVKEFLTHNPDGLNMLADRIGGMNWRQLRSRYKQKYKRSEVERVVRQLTPSQVQRIMKEYGKGGKGGYMSDLNKKIQGNLPSKTAERKIQKGKLKGYINIDDIFPD